MSLTYGFLNGTYTAAQFAETHLNAFGNGVCAFGGSFEVTARGSNGVSVGSGYALVGGYWVKASTSTTFYVAYGEAAGGRYDAIILRVDLQNRVADIVLERGIATSTPVKYEPVRSDSYYELILAYIYVAPATTLITSANIIDTRSSVDLCGIIMLSSELSKEILTMYAYTLSGFSNDISSLTANAQTAYNSILSNIQALEANYDEAYFESLLESLEEMLNNVNGLQEAWEKIDELDSAAGRVSEISYRIGDILETARTPVPTANWLLCNGESVPPTYPSLSTLLDGTLPMITPTDTRFHTWIYAGEPIS